MPDEKILKRVRGRANRATGHYTVNADIVAESEEPKFFQEAGNGPEDNRKRKRIDDNCGKNENQMRRKGWTRVAVRRRTFIEHLEETAAQQVHDTNARMQKREKAEGDDGGQGDPGAIKSSMREPTRTAASTWPASRRIGEVESITRLVQTLRPT